MPISIDELFSIPMIYWIDLSSDGRTLLYSSNASGAVHLYISQTKHGSRPKQITHGNDPVRFGFLSPSGKQVLYLQDKDGNGLHHLFLTSKDGTKTSKSPRNPAEPGMLVGIQAEMRFLAVIRLRSLVGSKFSM
jgi:WD40 repeat protein